MPQASSLCSAAFARLWISLPCSLVKRKPFINPAVIAGAAQGGYFQELCFTRLHPCMLFSALIHSTFRCTIRRFAACSPSALPLSFNCTVLSCMFTSVSIYFTQNWVFLSPCSVSRFLSRLDAKVYLILGANPQLSIGSTCKAGLWLCKQQQWHLLNQTPSKCKFIVLGDVQVLSVQSCIGVWLSVYHVTNVNARKEMKRWFLKPADNIPLLSSLITEQLWAGNVK